MDKGAGRFDWVEIAIGLALILVGGVVWFDASRLAPGSIYGVGPSAAPKLVAAGLFVLGAATLIQALRTAPRAIERADWSAVLVMLAGLLVLIVLIAGGGGFIIASTILFAATSWAFGRRTIIVDAGIGFVLAVVIYLLFTKLLTLGLPQGPLERLI
jgi:putative tricarboxylic transport membrane protein